MYVILLTKSKIKKVAIAIFTVILCFAAYTYVYNSNVGVFLGNSRKLPIYSVDTTDKLIAITFDSSWGEDNTLKLLNILDKYNAKATFFLIGRWCEEYPEETKEIVKHGDEVGNHSDKHPDMTRMSEGQIIKDINEADEKIFSLTGKKPDIFRCPSGSYDDNVISAVEKTNHKCIQWNIDSVDWKEQGKEIEYERVIKRVQPGSILLFHTNAKYTPENLERILKKLKAQGYKFVTISNLIYKENYYLDYTGKQIKK